MRQYKTILTAAFAAMMCTGVSAQNLNPTVEVSRTYEGKLLEMDKPQMRMNVPDSLLKVDLNFDYAVFDTPYQGAYEFKPYIMDMKPQPDAYSGRNLYIRTGAGYQFNPEFTGVYSPNMKGAFQMSLYGMHKGFFGQNRMLAPDYQNEIVALDKTGEKKTGHDMINRLGVSARADWEKSILTLDAGYNGFGFKQMQAQPVGKYWNAAELNARLRSNDYRSAYFLYDVALGVKLGADRVKTPGVDVSDNDIMKVSEKLFDINSTFGPVIDPSNRVLVDVDITVASYGGDFFKSHSGVLAVTPRYEFDHNRFDLSLGLRLSSLIRGNAGESDFTNHSHKGQNIYPVAYVSFEAIDERLMLYSELKGGENINTYSSILEWNHTFSPYMVNNGLASGSSDLVLLDNSVERFNVNLGAKGNIAQKFQYDLKTGFAKYANGLLEGGFLTGYSVFDNLFIPMVHYVDYNLAYTNAKFAWNPGSFEFEGVLDYKYTNLSHKHTGAFAPSKLAGNFSMKYNWNDRIHAGIWMAGQSARKMYSGQSNEVTLKVPGFVDLGILAEYQFNRKMSFFLQGANLLDMTIQRNVGYASPGINFTAGICLSL